MPSLQLKRRFILTLPFLLCVGFILLKSLSFDIFGFSQSYLTNLWGIIFYFAIFNVRVLNIITVFILGIFADILLQIPFGISVVMYSLLYFMGQFNQRYLGSSSFRIQWLFYALNTGALFIIGLGLLKMLYHHIPHFSYLAVEYAALILCYPIIAGVCGRLNRLIGRYQ